MYKPLLSIKIAPIKYEGIKNTPLGATVFAYKVFPQSLETLLE
jgi:hypothetical protein